MDRARHSGSGIRSGLGFGVGAYLIWGAMPVYFLAMRPAGPFEIVGWRVLFSLVFCALLIALTRSWRSIGAVFRRPRMLLTVGVAGVLIYVNWIVYVYATTSGHVVDAALGYFINPIVTILLGVIVLHERLRPAQWAAVGVSAVAVVVLTIEAGTLPWIALLLAASFGLYGFMKNRVGLSVDALTGLTLETAWLAPVAVLQLVLVSRIGGGLAFGAAGAWTTGFLSSAGVVTAVPLLLFAAAAKRLPLSLVGFLQYLTPVLQFGVGVVVLHEAMPMARWVGFFTVWVALALLIAEAAIAGRRAAVPADVTNG